MERSHAPPFPLYCFTPAHNVPLPIRTIQSYPSVCSPNASKGGGARTRERPTLRYATLRGSIRFDSIRLRAARVVGAWLSGPSQMRAGPPKTDGDTAQQVQYAPLFTVSRGVWPPLPRPRVCARTHAKPRCGGGPPFCRPLPLLGRANAHTSRRGKIEETVLRTQQRKRILGGNTRYFCRISISC
jgi:hypothetical protein